MSLEEGPFVFRVNENGSGPNLLKQVCMERGWREYTENWQMKDGWNLWWKTSAFSVSQHKHLKAWQFTNHIPKGASICRKDNLARNLKCMRKVYGAIYDISPHGYNLPLEYTKLVADCSRRDDDEDESQKVWICKPVGQSQGRGIFLFKSLSDLCYDSNAVVQRYIKNPLLIGGYKFDLRLYVCVPSYHPLTIYLYKEGLVRFSTDKFSLTDLNNPFCHLTNSSLNKLGPGYAEQKERVGTGCKWSLKQLRQYFQQAGIRDWLLWQRITALVTLTILSQSTSVPQTTNCFEFYGFDVLIDDKLKPWLLEVNLSPALGHDCDIDPVVKKPLLHDLFDLLGLPVCYTGLSLFTVYSPFDKKTHMLRNANIENEAGDSENRQLSLPKTRQKTAPHSLRNMSAIRSETSSAILAATAASKWRRKRKSHYLFGPPQRTGAESEKIKSEKKYSKSAIGLCSTVNASAPNPVKMKDDKKNNEKMVEVTLNAEGKQDRKCIRNGKRSREKENEKLKTIRGVGERLEAEVIKYEFQTVLKSASVENLKTLNKLENRDLSKKKKKTETERRHVKTRQAEPKNVNEKQKKSLKSADSKKAVVFPFDRSSSTAKGFKGRTKSTSPMLWGNGRDWRTPINREGDWGRIYPISNFNTKYTPTFEEDHLGNKCSVGDKQIRLVVHHITNFIKVSKQIYYKGVEATEEELNSKLINNLGMTGDVWLPAK